MTTDLTTHLAGLRLPAPVMAAAGCGGTGRELSAYLDLSALGGFVTRSITLDARVGSPVPRTAESASGLVNAVGLQNPGIDGFLATELPWLVQRKVRVFVSIAGSTLGEYAQLARRLASAPGVSGIEVNLSVPDAEGQDMFDAREPFHAARVVAAVTRDLPRGLPVLAKLGPDSSRVVEVARAVAEAGAEAVVLVNAAPAMEVTADLVPALGGVYGGLSGPAIRPMALRCVWDVHRALPDLPLVGVGGIGSGQDALAFLAAGATAVQLGTGMLHDPTCATRVVEQLGAALAERGAATPADVRGIAHRHLTDAPRQDPG